MNQTKTSTKNNKNSYLITTYGDKPFTSYPQKLSENLIKKFNLKKNSKILDLGCGRGEFLLGFINCGLDGYGIDQSDQASNLVQNKRLKKGSIDKKLPYLDNSFDIVFSKSVIEHFYYPEKIFSEIYRILKPGGFIITMTPDWKYNVEEFYEDFTHRTPFTKISLSDIHQIVGFKDIKVERFIQLPFFWHFKMLIFITTIIRNIMPTYFKKLSKTVRFSKEVMLLSFAKK